MISVEWNNHADRLTPRILSLTWLDGFNASADRVPVSLKAEVGAAVGRLTETDLHVMVIHLMDGQNGGNVTRGR